MDYIYIYDANNQKNKMEVVTIFKLDNHEYNYIIYKEIDVSRVYLAKFKEKREELITDISQEELALCQEVMNKVIL